MGILATSSKSDPPGVAHRPGGPTLLFRPGETKGTRQIVPRHRLYVDTPLVEGAQVALADDQAHRVLHVLRATAGESFALFNGRDGEWLAELDRVGKRGAALTVRERIRAQTGDSDLWLVFAPVKRGPLDLIAEKATELGISALVPVWTERTDPQRLNASRLRAIMIEAAEQCRRLSVPDLHEPRRLDEVIAAWPGGRRLIVLDESGAGAPIARVLAHASDAPTAFLVGPEGGFTESELDGLRSLSFAVAADLGPRILRAETAVIAALACYQALCGATADVPSVTTR